MKKLLMLRFKELWITQQAVAAIEAALVIPIMLLILFGMIECGYYLLLHMKMDKAIAVVGNAVSSPPANENGEICYGNNILTVYTAAVNEAMNPFTFNGDIGFSSIGTPITDNYSCPGQNQSCIYGRIGATNITVGSRSTSFTMPDGSQFSPGRGQHYVISEISHTYTPLIGFNFASIGYDMPFVTHNITRVSLYKVRGSGVVLFSGC